MLDWPAIRFFAQINLFGLGLLGFWTVIDTLLLPDMAARLAPPTLTASAVGLISVVGVGLAILVQPVAGRVSDALQRDDARRPFIILGLGVLVPGAVLFGWSPDFWALLAGFTVMQLGTNIAQAAFQALIPDLVDEHQRGVASGVKNLLSLLGAAIGLLGGAAIHTLTGSTALTLLFLLLLIGATGLATVRWSPPSHAGRHAEQAGSIRAALDVRRMIGEFRNVLAQHRTLRLAIVTQFLFMLGTYPAQRFLLLFLRDRFGNQAEVRASIGGVGAILLAVIGALAAGALSDAMPRTSVLMAAIVTGGAGLIVIGFSPTLAVAGLAGGLIAIGLGSFQAVNWALITDDLPSGQEAAALGIANIATAGAGTAAGLFGPLVDGINAVFPQGTYQTLFGLAGCIALLSIVPLRRIAASSSSASQQQADAPAD